MMEVSLSPQFRRQFRKLPRALQEETLEKIALFQKSESHEQLKVHKLHGRLQGRYAFSVNYSYRIVFMWEKPRVSAILLAIGDHALYQ